MQEAVSSQSSSNSTTVSSPKAMPCTLVPDIPYSKTYIPIFSLFQAILITFLLMWNANSTLQVPDIQVFMAACHLDNLQSTYKLFIPIYSSVPQLPNWFSIWDWLPLVLSLQMQDIWPQKQHTEWPQSLFMWISTKKPYLNAPLHTQLLPITGYWNWITHCIAKPTSNWYRNTVAASAHAYPHHLIPWWLS